MSFCRRLLPLNFWKMPLHQAKVTWGFPERLLCLPPQQVFWAPHDSPRCRLYRRQAIWCPAEVVACRPCLEPSGSEYDCLSSDCEPFFLTAKDPELLQTEEIRHWRTLCHQAGRRPLQFFQAPLLLYE